MAAPMSSKMSKILQSALTRHCKVCVKNVATAAKEARTWKLCSAVCLQRYPTLTNEMLDIEKRYQAYETKVEERNSYLSDHELDIIAEEARLEKMKHMTEEERRQAGFAGLLTIKEKLDIWTKEKNDFKLADRKTEADKSGNEKTADRLLDRKLVLIVKKQFKEGEPHWMFPTAERLPDESMRQTAERGLFSTCGEAIDATFFGNAPCGFHQYKLPQRYTGPEYGVKLFFFKAAYTTGEVEESEGIVDWKWVTMDQLPEYLHPKYMKDVKQFLVDS